MAAQPQQLPPQDIIARSEAFVPRLAAAYPRLKTHYANGAADWSAFSPYRVIVGSDPIPEEAWAGAQEIKQVPDLPDEKQTPEELRAWIASLHLKPLARPDTPPPAETCPPAAPPVLDRQEGGDPTPGAVSALLDGCDPTTIISKEISAAEWVAGEESSGQPPVAAGNAQSVAQCEHLVGQADPLDLPDADFMAAWQELTDAQRSQIGAEGFRRYRALMGVSGRAEPPATILEPIDACGYDGYDEAMAAEEAALASIRRATAAQTHIKEARGKPLDWAKLAVAGDPPPRRWAIKGWLGFGHVTLLIGQGGIGKTLIAQQLATCLAIGRGFIEDTTAEQQRVLMWACEDDHDELWRRQVAICKWLDIGMEELGQNLVIEPRAGLENALVVSDYGKASFTPLIGTLEAQAGALNAGIVILDNIAQLFGAGENDRHAVTVFLNALVGALPERAILLLGHPSRGQGSEFSGSSAWENCARTRLYLGRELPDASTQRQDERAEDSDDTVRFLCRRKANYSSRDYRRMSYENGVLIPEQPLIPKDGNDGYLRIAQAERVILEGLKKLQELGLQPSEGATTARYLPKLILEYKLSEGLSKGDLGSAMRRLMLDKRITKGIIGKYAGNRSPMYGLSITGDGK